MSADHAVPRTEGASRAGKLSAEPTVVKATNRTPEVFVSGLFTMNDLPTLLGALDHFCAACAANIPTP